MNKKILKLCTGAVLMALTFIITSYVRLPIAIPGLKDAYFHLGDTVVFIGAFYLGGWYGAAIGGIGGMIADVIFAPVYFMATLIIKSMMGLTAGVFLKMSKGPVTRVLAMIIPCLLMIGGYFVFEWAILGNQISAVYNSVLGNVLQATGSIVAASICIPVLNKFTPVKRLYK